MKLLRTILLVLVALGACGCTINVPGPPDIEIHGEVNTGDGANSAAGEAKTDRDR